MKPGSPKLSESWQGGLPHDWKFPAAAGAIVIVALLLRIYRLGAQEFWLDEVLSFHMATTPDWLGAPLIENDTPPLYYLLLRGWMTLAGQSEASVRLLSAVFGTLFVAVVIWAGREIFDSRVGLWCGAISAVAPIHIYYSQEARAYALLTFALLATYATLWRALRTNLWRWWALFSASALLALYSHYFSLFALIPTVLLLLLWPEKQQEKQRWLRYGAASLASGLFFLPWFLWSFIFTPHAWTNDWIAVSWKHTPPSLAIPKSLEVFGLGSQAGLLTIYLKQFARLEFPFFLRLLHIAIVLVVGIWVGIPCGDRALRLSWLGKRKAFLAILLFFPLVALWLISLRKPVYVVGRYDLVGFPAYILLLGLGMTKVQTIIKAGPVLAFLAALALFVPIGTKLVLYYHIPPNEISRSTARLLDASVKNDDLVVFSGARGLILLYYMNRLGYHWQDGSCVNDAAGRRFLCRIIPERFERRLTSASVSDTRQPWADRTEEVRGKVAEFAHTLLFQRVALWVVFEGNNVLAQQGVTVSPPDRRLLDELRRVGLDPVPVNPELGIFRIAR